QTNCLQYLDARNTPLLDHSAPFVARALRISSSLVVLHLENTSISGRPLMLLATALKMNMNLRELYLADNKLNGLQDSAQLGNLLKFNCYIQILDLRNNHILDSGLAYICEGLKEQRKGLVTLVLWNNQLTHTGMAYLGMTLPHTQSLETLNLGHNPIGNEGVRNLKNGLIGNRSVLRLGLASTKLTCEGEWRLVPTPGSTAAPVPLVTPTLKAPHLTLLLSSPWGPHQPLVKSFIETQRALLAEIQNGCKRNFILAREQEEKEQKLQQSTSMPEITVTEEALEEGPAEDGRDSSTRSTPEEGEEAGETLMSSENGDVEPTEDDDRDDVMDSDSDTDEEVDAGEPVTATSSPSQGNERRISVSSPGRGHKIFVVTRVENPELPPLQVTPTEPQSPALPTDPELPPLWANGTIPEAAADLGTSSDPEQGDPPACESHNTPLPNGLKTDFARALPEASSDGDGKMGSCAAEHELSCSKNEQELEELLLEASQDTGQELL
ncbi:PPR37 phosphatase, partial [Nyctiprogne leucopyga]|nr:PPR37 phosphatase [Nyctiprogne leucopyga]